MESRGKIYLATSDAGMLDTLRGVLEPEGHRLQEPMDPALAAEEAGFFGADVVLLSAWLDGQDSHAVLARLKDPHSNEVSVIVLAPEGDDVALGSWLDAGADDVLNGPIHARELLHRVALQLRLREQAKGAEVLPEQLYAPLGEESDPAPSGSGPRVPQHLPKGLDGFYEADLATLIEVSEAFASSLEVEDALYVIVRRLARTIPVSRCSVSIRGVKPDEVIVVATHDDASMRNKVNKLSRYPEIRRCLEGGELLLIEDVHGDEDMREVLDFIKSVDLRSALVLPLYVKEVAVGTLSMTSRRAARGFTQRELLFARAMENMAAGAIAAGDLIERIRRDSGEDEDIKGFDEVVLDQEDAIVGLIEELERK